MLRQKYDIVAEMPGTALVGWTYDGPFDDLKRPSKPGGFYALRERLSSSTERAEEAHRVIVWDEVSETEGTGIVHIAPGCGAEDFALGKTQQLPIVAPLDDEGYFVAGFGWLTGKHVSEVPTPSARIWSKRAALSRRKYTHRYPTCWRCDMELVFRLVDEWFISMDELRHDMMEITRQIRWIPAFGLERELDWLRNMHDWMISKKRYWGLALPIWECAYLRPLGLSSATKLNSKSEPSRARRSLRGHTPHRPWIDAVKIECEQCGGLMTRIADVGNPWLDAGIVSFSTLRYRQDREYWRKWYPADWISECSPASSATGFTACWSWATV